MHSVFRFVYDLSAFSQRVWLDITRWSSTFSTVVEFFKNFVWDEDVKMYFFFGGWGRKRWVACRVLFYFTGACYGSIFHERTVVQRIYFRGGCILFFMLVARYPCHAHAIQDRGMHRMPRAWAHARCKLLVTNSRRLWSDICWAGWGYGHFYFIMEDVFKAEIAVLWAARISGGSQFLVTEMHERDIFGEDSGADEEALWRIPDPGDRGAGKRYPWRRHRCRWGSACRWWRIFKIVCVFLPLCSW